MNEERLPSVQGSKMRWVRGQAAGGEEGRSLPDQLVLAFALAITLASACGLDRDTTCVTLDETRAHDLARELVGTWNGEARGVETESGGALRSWDGIWFEFLDTGRYDSNFGSKFEEDSGYPATFSGQYEVLGENMLALAYSSGWEGWSFVSTPTVSLAAGTLYIGQLLPASDSWYCVLEKTSD